MRVRQNLTPKRESYPQAVFAGMDLFIYPTSSRPRMGKTRLAHSPEGGGLCIIRGFLWAFSPVNLLTQLGWFDLSQLDQFD